MRTRPRAGTFVCACARASALVFTVPSVYGIQLIILLLIVFTYMYLLFVTSSRTGHEACAPSWDRRQRQLRHSVVLVGVGEMRFFFFIGL